MVPLGAAKAAATGLFHRTRYISLFHVFSECLPRAACPRLETRRRADVSDVRVIPINTQACQRCSATALISIKARLTSRARAVHSGGATTQTERYGADAAVQPAARGEDLLDEGDVDGAGTWRRIANAIDQLQAEKPAEGEALQ